MQILHLKHGVADLIKNEVLLTAVQAVEEGHDWLLLLVHLGPCARQPGQAPSFLLLFGRLVAVRG